VTGKLTVNYIAPTPFDADIEVRAVLAEVSERKTIVKSSVYSGETLTAEGEMVAVRVADSWKNAR
jgi:acyl-CoA thioesterase FadM